VSTTLETISRVRSSPLFGEFSEEDLTKLAPYLDEVEFPKGVKIFEQEAEGDALYIILSGQVGVIRKGAKDKGQQRERMLAVVGAGECIGEMALADGGPRSASVTTLEFVNALRFAKSNFNSMRDAEPKLAIRLTLGIFRLLSKRLRQINNSLEMVHYWMFA
jgi:CRP/FNR family cyclic AMP-dependent transcriptional regulator